MSIENEIKVIEENVRPYINHVYTDYLLLSDRELKVLLALKSYAWNQKDNCHPSLDTLAKLTGKKRRQLIEILHSLEKKGLIRIKSNSGKASTYFITNKCMNPEKLSTKTKQPVRKSAPGWCGNPHQGGAEIRTRSNISNNTKEKKDKSFCEKQKIENQKKHDWANPKAPLASVEHQTTTYDPTKPTRADNPSPLLAGWKH